MIVRRLLRARLSVTPAPGALNAALRKLRDLRFERIALGTGRMAELGEASVWQVGPERRLVRGAAGSGEEVAFVLAPALVDEIEREPAGRAARPPFGLRKQPSILCIGPRAVMTAQAASARLHPRRLVLLEPDGPTADLVSMLVGDRIPTGYELLVGDPGALLDDEVLERAGFDLVVLDLVDASAAVVADRLDDAVAMLATGGALAVLHRADTHAPDRASATGELGSITDLERVPDLVRELCDVVVSHVVRQRTSAVLTFGCFQRRAAEERLTSVRRGVDQRRQNEPGSPPHIDIEVVDDLSSLASLRDVWNEIVQESPYTSSYQSPGWVIPWFEFFQGTARMHTVVARRRGAVVAVVPMVRRRVGGPVGLDVMWTAGTEHGDYGEPALGAHPDVVARRIAGHFGDLVRAGRTVVEFRRLVDDGPLGRALGDEPGLRFVPVRGVGNSAVIRFSQEPDPAAYLDRLMKKNRLPQKRQKLEDLLGEVRFEPHDQQIDEVLDFMQMSMRKRFADGGPTIFDTQRRSAFTRQTTLELMADGVARLSTLRSADRLLAVEIVHEIDGVHISDFGAFDGDLRSYSLGYMILHEVLRQALSEGMQAVDLRGGDFPDKYAWSNSGRVSRSFSVVRPGWYGDVQFRARVIANRRRRLELAVIDRTPIGTLG